MPEWSLGRLALIDLSHVGCSARAMDQWGWGMGEWAIAMANANECGAMDENAPLNGVVPPISIDRTTVAPRGNRKKPKSMSVATFIAGVDWRAQELVRASTTTPMQCGPSLSSALNR